MKKFILSFVMALSLLFVSNIDTQAQSALNVQAGWSWSEGNVSAGYQFKTLEIKGGWMFTKMPGDGESVAGPVVTLIWGPEWDESGYYLSYSFNSVGYRSQYSYNGGYWTDGYVEGMNIISLGYKVGTDVWYLKADVGYGWSANGKGTSWGVVLGFPLLGSY